MDQILQPDSGLYRVAMIEDVGDEAFVQAVEMKQRVVGDNEVRP
jgi:hypothetical protein